MAHWEHRPEQSGKVQLQPALCQGPQAAEEEVLAKTDFDPATLWQWGTMQAMALIDVSGRPRPVRRERARSRVWCADARSGTTSGGRSWRARGGPQELAEAEFASYFATVVNRIAYASLEDPQDRRRGSVSFDILWCPHQDHYEAFDCRVQRYFVQGMIEAAREFACKLGWEVRFDTTIPAGAPTCHFTMWKPDDGERAVWENYTKLVEAKALTRAKHK